jgi:adenylate kinase
LFGAPGVGKGTQSANLVRVLGMKQISTGDLFRTAINNKTKLGLEVKSFIDRGDLVPDNLVTGLVKESLSVFFLNNESGLILDGYPRTLEQAENLSEILANIGKKIDRVVFIRLDENEIIERLVGRRICKVCGSVYHVKVMPPQRLGICDKCGGELIQRTDDKEDVIRSRLDIYAKSTQSLSEYYEKKGCLREIDGGGSSQNVFEKLMESLKN